MKQADKLLALAREQLGTTESPPGSNNVKYNTAYYGGEVRGRNYPWCCAFIWWLFRECGLSELFCGGQKTAYCPFVVQYARDNGKWRTEGYRPGDLLLYDWDDDGVADHIGICETDTDEGGHLWAIEGNCGDSVQRARRWTGSILGAYRPAYDEAPGAEASEDPAAPETYTVRKGDMLGRIAARHGTTVEELVRLNNIKNPNRIYPGQVLRLRESGETVTVTLTLKRSVFARYGSVSRIEEVLAG
ncbi:MAG: LysM peptidoglycan-binding domain-containing protein [Oscillospiraceae bacterium]|nr:LysM peptidoglycan-binding domain-containing protein [Oscillospiraceae bacterium]